MMSLWPADSGWYWLAVCVCGALFLAVRPRRSIPGAGASRRGYWVLLATFCSAAVVTGLLPPALVLQELGALDDAYFVLSNTWMWLAAAAVLGLIGVAFTVWMICGLRRPKTPRCRRCGYSMIGITGRTCPECGRAHAHDAEMLRGRFRKRRAALALAAFALAFGIGATPFVSATTAARVIPRWILLVCVRWWPDSPLAWAATYDQENESPVSGLERWALVGTCRELLRGADSAHACSLLRFFSCEHLLVPELESAIQVSGALSREDIAMCLAGARAARSHAGAVLLGLLHDSDADVRSTAERGLQQLWSSQADPPRELAPVQLHIWAFAIWDLPARRAALTALLTYLPDKPMAATGWLAGADPSMQVRRLGTSLLLRADPHGQATFALLSAALRDEEELRTNAISNLFEHGWFTESPQVREAIHVAIDEMTSAGACQEACADIGNGGARREWRAAALQRALWNPACRQSALDELTRAGLFNEEILVDLDRLADITSAANPPEAMRLRRTAQVWRGGVARIGERLPRAEDSADQE